jgi:hypothetical protein
MKINGFLKFILIAVVVWLFYLTISWNRYALHNSSIGNSDELYRINKMTGQTHVYDNEIGGWLLLSETDYVTVSPGEGNN